MSGESTAEGYGVLNWPGRDAWLARCLAEPERNRFRAGAVVPQVSDGRLDPSLDVWDRGTQQRECYTALHVPAMTVFTAVRRLEALPVALLQQSAAHGPRRARRAARADR